MAQPKKSKGAEAIHWGRKIAISPTTNTIEGMSQKKSPRRESLTTLAKVIYCPTAPKIRMAPKM